MPVINFNYNDLCSLIGKKVPKDVLIDRIPLMGADMHDASADTDEMSVEFFPDRPDLFSAEGLARSLRAFLQFCLRKSNMNRISITRQSGKIF